jgi:hypothetical protein
LSNVKVGPPAREISENVSCPQFLRNANSRGIQKAVGLYIEWKKNETQILEGTMKKMLVTTLMVLSVSLGSWTESRKESRYVNLSFTVWKLENGPSEAARRINTPIPEVLRESWICDFMVLNVTEEKTVTRAMEKEELRFVLTAEEAGRLIIQVYEKEKEVLRFAHNRPSTVNTIFYDIYGRTYLIEATHTVNDHPIALVSPGILKK